MAPLPTQTATMSERLKVLFLVEGFTDIRFVVGLSEICDLTMATPARHYHTSGLCDRIAYSGAKLAVEEIAGGTLAFQLRSLAWLWRRAREFDVVLAQEALRGALNAGLVGRIRGVPVVTHMGISPIEYFRCRRDRGQIGWIAWRVGEAVIRTLLRVNGRLAARAIGVGPYLEKVVARYSKHPGWHQCYGVDTDFFRPVDPPMKGELRQRLGLPVDKFLVFVSSRVSHEKDPETALKAVALARERGLSAMVLNLGGGYREFLDLARRLQLPEADTWVTARPAVHPMTELAPYYQAADALIQASLAEGAGISPLEALACGIPVVATAVGGLAAILQGRARLVPRGDASAAADELLWIAAHPSEARAEALRARQYVVDQWDRRKTFADLLAILESTASQAGRTERTAFPGTSR